MVICCCFQTFKELLGFTFCPFFHWECKCKGLYFITQIYLNFYLIFSFEKTRFLIGSAKVRAKHLPTKSNFIFDENIIDESDICRV